jgi:hypothetical protein
MKKPAVIIAIATLYLFFFHLSPYINIPDAVIIAMFIFSPIVLIYTLYVILKFGKSSKYTFEEKFYDDTDYSRNNQQAD